MSLRGRRPSCPTRTHEQRSNGNGCEGTTVMRCNAELTTAQIQRHVQLDASIQARCFERCSLSDSLRASPSRLTQTAAADRRSRVWIVALDGVHIGGTPRISRSTAMVGRQGSAQASSVRSTWDILSARSSRNTSIRAYPLTRFHRLTHRPEPATQSSFRYIRRFQRKRIGHQRRSQMVARMVSHT